MHLNINYPYKVRARISLIPLALPYYLSYL